MQVSHCLTRGSDNLSESFLRGLLGRKRVAIKRGTTGSGCGIHRGSEVRLRVPSSDRPSVIPRSVPLSVLCRSRSMLVIGGPGKVIMRPTTKRCRKALIGTIVTRYNSDLSNVGKIVQPKVIREVSGSAAKTLLMYGGSVTRQSLTRRLGYRDVHEHCQTIIRKGLGRSRKAVRKPVKQRPASHGGVTVGRGGNGSTVARCGILRHFNRTACIRYHLRANHARRVHIRVTDVKRPLLKSAICNSSEGLCRLRKRTLRTVVLKFIRPHAERCVRFATPLPRCFIGLLAGLQG